MSTARQLPDAWLEAGSLHELRAQVHQARRDLTLPQAQAVTARARALAPEGRPLRLGIVHTYTSNLLDPWLRLESALQGIALDTYHAPYGVTMQEAQPGSGLVRHAPDLTLLLLQWEDLHPELAAPLSAMDAAARDRLRDEAVERLVALAARFRGQIDGQLVLTILPPYLAPGLGLYDAHSERSEAAWRSATQAQLARELRARVSASLFLDLGEILTDLGRERFFDPRFWYASRFPFTPAAARELARRVMALGAVSLYPRAKVIALDADNTLWGGIIGEEGIHGIALGPEYPGNAYMAFQRRLLDYQQRGFILALCSKNNPRDVDEVLASHPHQLLRDGHFAARRVNWEPKPRNLAALAEELNLGLDAFVFVDDSPHECAAVRHSLPQVEVVQVPGRAVDVPGCLDRVARLEVLSVTTEDLAKTRLYADERRRRDLKASVDQSGGGMAEYLASLNMRMRVGFDNPDHLARLTQLTQKTNQFNLTTRRYDEQQMRGFIESPEWLVAHFALADIFGDSGIVGLALVQRTAPGEGVLDTFLMSCRVIGRGAESAFLDVLLRRLADEGVREVVGDYLPTAKNALVEHFLPEHHFARDGEGRYRRDLRTNPPEPASAHPIAVESSR